MVSGKKSVKFFPLLKTYRFTFWWIFTSHSVEKRKFTLSFFRQKFRERNVFIKEVTKELISRKKVSVQCIENWDWISHSKTLSPFLRKINIFSRQINGFTKEVTKEYIWRKFLTLIAFYSTFPQCAVWVQFPHCVNK